MSNAYTISSTTKWGGTSRFLQDIIVCTKYAPFHQLPSRALSGFSRVLLSVRRMYHAQPTIVGLAQAQPNSHLMLKSSINVLYSLNRSHGVNFLLCTVDPKGLHKSDLALHVQYSNLSKNSPAYI